MSNHFGSEKRCYWRPVFSAAQQGARYHVFLVCQGWKAQQKDLQAKKYETPKLAAASAGLPQTMIAQVQNGSLGQVKYFLGTGIHLMYKQPFMLTSQ